jgi:pSer/pThr/pTyr-binding forkhead associated (FHA) protein
MRLVARLMAPSGEALREVSVTAFPARIGRDPRAEVAVGDHEFPVVSGLHALIDRTPDGLVLTALSPKNLTLHNNRPVGEPVVLRAGDRVRLGATGPTVLVVAIEADPEPPAPRPVARRRRGRALVLWAVGLGLHLVAVLLALIIAGVLANPFASPAVRPSP